MTAEDATGDPRPARRLHAPGLRDPRLVIGVVVMALSVIVGSLLLGGHAGAHTALVLRHRVHAGQALRAGDLRPAPVDLADRRSGVLYFLDGATPRSGSTAGRELSAGELLPRSAVTTGADHSLTELPLSVAVDDLPVTVHAGSTVDVWVVPESAKERADASAAADAELVVAAVPVIRVGKDGQALAPRSTRQVIVGIPGADDSDPAQQRSQGKSLARLLGQAASGRVLITRRG